MYLIKNVTIFDGFELIENKNVLISQNKIIDVVDASSTTAHIVKDEIDGHGHILAPGFIDIQVNGGGGAFFNSLPTVETIKKIASTHLQFGTTSILPTFMSDTFENIKQALHAVKNALNESVTEILGVHLEGPYFNLQKKGIHNPQYIRPPIKEEINEICQFELPIKLVTLAPEIVSQDFVQQLAKNKVYVFAGHTNATFAQISDAFSYGVCGITHLFNACSPLTSREPGVVGAGLLNDNIWCGLIADGYHVSYNSIKLAFKAKKKNHFILVSDAMSPVGTNATEFIIQGQKINVVENKYVDENGVLAGSSLTMLQALKNIVSHNCATVAEALAMTSTNPAKCLQIDHIKGKVCPNYDADLVLLNKHNLDLLKVVKNGVIVYGV